jgi:hypothetical protein
VAQRVSQSLSESFKGNDGEGCADWRMRTHFFDKGSSVRATSLSVLYSWGAYEGFIVKRQSQTSFLKKFHGRINILKLLHHTKPSGRL